MKSVKPKKHLGQHFLLDLSIAERIVEALGSKDKPRKVLEIGPGTGVLTDFLKNRADVQLYLLDIDTESIVFLKEKYGQEPIDIIEGDFLKHDLRPYFEDTYAIIGNFPYNISSQIFFRVLEDRQQVEEVVCMLQKEVARRIASPPGSKEYGILSVLLQAYYDIEYLFMVGPDVFDPPPKVDSAVIRLVRNDVKELSCNERLFKTIVKQGFNNRRKTLRNALKAMGFSDALKSEMILDKRAEQLSVEDFILLTQKIAQDGNDQKL